MDTLQILLTEQQIQEKVTEMAAAISKAYGGKSVYVVGLLDNSFMFVADLVRRLTCPVSCTFTKQIMKDVKENGFDRRLVEYAPPVEAKGRHLLLVDTVLQTGITHDHFMSQCVTKGAASVKLATLIDKTDDRHVPLQPDYSGFQMEGHFLVGYGMAFGELYRNLPHIASLTRKAEEPKAVGAASEKKE